MASARLIPNIFWNIVPLSAFSTRTTLPALPALVTALMHRKILRKTLRKTLQQLLLRCQRKAMLQHSAVAGPSVRPRGTMLGRCDSGALRQPRTFWIRSVKKRMVLPQNQHPKGGHGEWESL